MLVDTFSNRLYLAMLSAKMKQIDLCKKTGLDKSLINKYLSGKSNAKSDKLSILAKALNVDEIWLMGYNIPVNNNNSSYYIPLLGNINSGSNFLNKSNWIDTIYLPNKLQNSGNFFALKIMDESMSPAIFPEDIVFIRKQNFCNNDDIALICINTNETILRKVKKINTGIVLHAFNSNYEPLFFDYSSENSISIEIIGVVKQLTRSF